jgi:hypothetical protein
MQCPHCGKWIEESQLSPQEAAAVMGRIGRGAAKARDPKKMSAAGKRGGWPKGRKRKVALTLFLLASLCLPLTAAAGQLRQWAPGRWVYTDDNGRRSEEWTWAPGHTTWTDDCGRRREVWEWSPGNFEVDDED